MGGRGGAVAAASLGMRATRVPRWSAPTVPPCRVGPGAVSP